MALRNTLQFENKINLDLRKEYQQYLDQTFTEEQRKEDPSLRFRITSLYKVHGSISNCFEMYMRPYVSKEEHELRNSTMVKLEADLTDPQANSMETEGVRILNSSMHMFSNIKHLLKRASSISKGQIMFDVFNVVRRVIALYIQKVSDTFKSDEKSLARRQEKNFVVRACIYINTIDYIKETLDSVSDLVVTLVSDPFGEKIDFGQEEEMGLSALNTIVNGIKRLVEGPIDMAIGNHMTKITWDRYDSGISEASYYIKEIRERLNTIIGYVRGNIGDVYMTQILNTICQITNQKFINAVLKMKKISDMGIQQLICGKFDV